MRHQDITASIIPNISFLILLSSLLSIFAWPSEEKFINSIVERRNQQHSPSLDDDDDLDWMNFYNGNIDCAVICSKTCMTVLDKTINTSDGDVNGSVVSISSFASGDCMDIVSDPCNCCTICVRNLNQSCGFSIGICAHNLRCRYDDPNVDVGKCVVMWPDSCLKAKCEMVYHNKCPEDSRLVVQPPPAGECCSPPGECQCDKQRCHPWVPICAKGFKRVLVKEGSSNPGDCCDTFECKRPEMHCENARCRKDIFADEACPTDSVRAPSYVPVDSCCPIYPGCQCRASICLPARCPDGEKVLVLRKGDGTPGKCCDHIVCESDRTASLSEKKSCPYGNEIYDEGEVWHSTSCEICKCKGGIALCSKMSCPNPPSACTWVGIPVNECCPICLGCDTDGEKRTANEIWLKDDCTSCTCGFDGVQYCQKHMCQVDCDHPRKIPGQCCPVCDEPTIILNPAICPSLEHCPLRCENGLARDELGCFQCSCSTDNEPAHSECVLLDNMNCDKSCAHGYMRGAKGCVICKCAKCPHLNQCYKHCLYGFEVNNFGCPICKCRAISRIDAKLSSRNGKSESDRCISVSLNTGKPVERDSGEWWNDGCRHCFCEQRHEFCSLISCPERDPLCPGDKWKTKEGSCCALCDHSSPAVEHEHTVCQSSGRMFVDGETWQLASCVSCTCRVGNVLCRVVDCPPIACSQPVHDPSNKCCSMCPQAENNSTQTKKGIVCEDSNNVVHALESSWRVKDCISCRCVLDSGKPKILSYEEECEPQEDCLGLPLLIKGRCCPICSDALSSGDICKYKKNVYNVNEEWRDGLCQNCTCRAGGQTVCREHHCAICSDPVYVPGQCCPICKVGTRQQESEGEPHSIVLQNDGSGRSLSTELIYGICITSTLLLIVMVLVIAYRIFKWSRSSEKKKSPIRFNNSAMLLSTSRPIGSSSRIYEGIKNCHNIIDGQCDSLLSTASDTSSAASSNVSSVHGPHFDTLPLTSKKFVSRTKSVDYGICARKGFGSFKTNNTFKNNGDKHGSCNV